MTKIKLVVYVLGVIASFGVQITDTSLCKPNSQFKLDCNTCSCSDNGMKYSCSDMACPPLVYKDKYLIEKTENGFSILKPKNLADDKGNGVNNLFVDDGISKNIYSRGQRFIDPTLQDPDYINDESVGNDLTFTNKKSDSGIANTDDDDFIVRSDSDYSILKQSNVDDDDQIITNGLFDDDFSSNAVNRREEKLFDPYRNDAIPRRGNIYDYQSIGSNRGIEATVNKYNGLDGNSLEDRQNIFSIFRPESRNVGKNYNDNSRDQIYTYPYKLDETLLQEDENVQRNIDNGNIYNNSPYWDSEIELKNNYK